MSTMTISRIYTTVPDDGCTPVQQEVLHLLERLHIQTPWLRRYPQELSGGELQRFCIARALGPTTRYLLCDEITAMLDGITQAQIWNFLLEESRSRGIGLLVVSHNSALLQRLCGRIVSLPPWGQGPAPR